MKTDPVPDIREDRTTLTIVRAPMIMVFVTVGFVGVGAAIGLALLSEENQRHFFHAYLLNFCYLLSISLGALFFVAIQHLCRAGWSVTVRRLAEIVAGNLVFVAILFVPILVQIFASRTTVYSWLNPEVVTGDHVLEGKSSYLNLPFFIIRLAVYFVIWGFLARYFLSRSTRQDDTGEPELTTRMEWLSAPALLLFAVTVSFASFDLLMSLNPHWFSTIFGLYFFSGAVVAGLATIILLAMALQISGWLVNSITVEHYHELGKLLFGFIIFWGYMAFSQYMLIWYANIPEETVWFLGRQTGPWVGLSLVLLFGHLLIPFFGLLPRAVKREKAILGIWAIWMLLVHWLDIYWLVMPELARVLGTPSRMPFGLIDIATLVGLTAFYLAGAFLLAGDRSLVPTKDPRLNEALAYHNP
jgi:hypothetical protein